MESGDFTAGGATTFVGHLGIKINVVLVCACVRLRVCVIFRHRHLCTCYCKIPQTTLQLTFMTKLHAFETQYGSIKCILTTAAHFERLYPF